MKVDRCALSEAMREASEKDYLRQQREVQERIGRVFMPGLMRGLDDLFKPSNQFKLVHYTSADVAELIMKNREIWLRSTQYVNDTSEIHHGFALIERLFGLNGKAEQGGSRLLRALDQIHKGVGEAVVPYFRARYDDILNNTFISCVSKHALHEREHGRLSMWRAYGRKSGVALVLNPEPFRSTSDVLKAYSAPVLYGGWDEFIRDMSEVTDKIEASAEKLRFIPAHDLIKIVHMMLLLTVTCIKHPSFVEEQEWRVIYTPTEFHSSVIKPANITIGGISQTINKLSLKDYPRQGLSGIEIPQLIDNVIVGPLGDPVHTRERMIAALIEAGVSDAENKVTLSNIPLRIDGY
ncbi:DUF2971 domain-containing protein [Phyllobacterium myrsinacearum]|uniref:DUF2971 domain-containing protein n=1 Tax=Phyllobacterium myrsinacearum TaxID=28101 RepID=A0A839EU43_9HYPH|nr:DUF2971 domain-containing protein [Phyllobacterium myrsinacearum]MBA8880866.1 hypothetical protein [Phyllobacterium myrsinacearum]